MGILRAYEKAKAVISSSTNEYHLEAASKYVNLFLAQYSETYFNRKKEKYLLVKSTVGEFYKELSKLLLEQKSKLSIFLIGILLVVSSCSKDPLELDEISPIDPTPELQIGNYGTPSHSAINNTTGGVIRNRQNPGFYVTRENTPIPLDTIVNGKTYYAVESALLIFDYNNDGKKDVFAHMMESTPCSTNCGWITGPGIFLWWEDYENTKAPVVVDSHLWFGVRFDVGDFNGDGTLEVVAINQNHHSDGNGGWYAPYHPMEIITFTDTSFTVEDIGGPSSAHDVETGDIDNDGDVDIIEAEWMYGAPFNPSTPKFYINNGNGQFEVTKELFGPYPIFVEAEGFDFSVTNIDLFDFNNDGFLDLLVGENNIEWDWWSQDILDFFERSGYHPNDIAIMFGDGTGYFGYENSFKTRYGTPTVAANLGIGVPLMGGNFIDYNNDGYYDYIVATDYNGSGAGFKLFKNVNGESLEDVTSTFVTDYVTLYSKAFSTGMGAQISPGEMSSFFEVVILDQDNDGDYDIMPYSQVLMDNTSTFKSGVYWENIGGNFILKK